MDTALWIIQIFLALSFATTGLLKLTQPRERLAPKLAWVEDFSDAQVKAIGGLELAGAIGLVLPPALDVAPVLVPLAAAGLVLTMIGAAATHLRRGEPSFLPLNLILGALALFVAIMRFGPESF